jgi:CheY-like chemotaxis protein
MSEVDNSRRVVMYVEDQPVNVALMEALFKRRPDLRLAVATTGAAASQLALGLEPVLMLLDLQLPDCHGSNLLPELRRHPGCRDAPAVAVTAEHDFEIEGTGFSEIWTKPLNLLRVLARLNGLVPPTPGNRAGGKGPERSSPGSTSRFGAAAGCGV